jgi:hypothetical protein
VFWEDAAEGAVDLCKQAGLPDENILKWDLPETTAKPGPYKEITDSDIFVNCIYLSDEIPPFVNDKSLSDPDRKLSVVCDVSCETTNPHNPIPIYKENSTFDRPTLPVKVERGPPLTVISIDYLPSLLPREASEAFSQASLAFAPAAQRAQDGACLDPSREALHRQGHDLAGKPSFYVRGGDGPEWGCEVKIGPCMSLSQNVSR